MVERKIRLLPDDDETEVAVENENVRSDAELIRGYLAGSPGDFECLYHKYRRQLYSYLNALLEQDSARVDDVFQQTWIKVIDTLPRYDDRNVFLAYLLRIAHNAAMDSCREKRRREEIEVPVSPGEKGRKGEENEVSPGAGKEDERYVPGKDMEKRELAGAIEQAVGELKEELKEVFLLRMEDLSFKEIARIQNCSINTVLARMQYALKRLRVTLKDWEDVAG